MKKYKKIEDISPEERAKGYVVYHPHSKTFSIEKFVSVWEEMDKEGRVNSYALDKKKKLYVILPFFRPDRVWAQLKTN